MGRDPFDSKLNEMEKALNLLVKHANDASFRSYADDNGSGNATDALNDLRKKINDAKKAFDDFCDEMM